MQAYAEGFDILRNAGSADLDAGLRYDLDCRDIAEVWRRGSVVSSWLLDLTAQALAESPALSNYTGIVQDSGEGRWTVIAAIDLFRGRRDPRTRRRDAWRGGRRRRGAARRRMTGCARPAPS